MIRLVKTGEFRLMETKGLNRLLILDRKKVYAWIPIKKAAEILVASLKEHREAYILAQGYYRIYDVEQEVGLSDQIHLELSVGMGQWQGYILPTGLPTQKNNRNLIVPTHELITLSRAPSYFGIDD